MLVSFTNNICLVTYRYLSFSGGKYIYVIELDEEKRAGCFAFIVFLMSYYCKCPEALPHGAVGWSAVRDCGIS